MKNYVQIGSNIGNDDFYEMCRNVSEKTNILLIEPNGLLLQQLEENYRELKNDNLNIKIFNIGIVSNIQNINNLYIYHDGGLSSTLRRRTLGEPIEKIKFIPKTFNDFCLEHEISNIEVLFIDTEGLDYEILNSIDIEKINIKDIYFEYWPHENDDLNGKVLTGDHQLKKVFDKYKDYSIKEIILGGMKSYQMQKNNLSIF